jgi:protein TonB
MFEDSLLESGGKLKTKAKYTTLLSFVIQVVLIIILVLIPLIYTEALPAKAMLTGLVAPPPPPPPPPPPAPTVVVKKITSDIVDGSLRTPTKIPNKVVKVVEEEPPPQAVSTGVPGGVPGGIPGGAPGGVMGSILGAANSTAPRVQPSRLKISSGVTQGLLISRVTPQYPPIAKSARVQGTVVLQAIISKQGTIENLKVISGHPMLIQSAIDAVSRWRYKPYILNGEPVEVETTVNVNFNLQGGGD